MKVKIINLILLTSCFLLPVIPVLAQPTTPSAPVDGGLSLLIAGGVGYGIKKIREKRNNQQNENRNSKM